MPYMGFDRENLEALRTAMRRANEQLGSQSCCDPLAMTATHTVSKVQAALQLTWLPVLDGILQCMAMESRVPVRIGADDLQPVWLASRQEMGWQIVTDPMQPLTVSIAQATALGESLADGDLEELLDTEAELIWLAGVLAIIADEPALTVAFRNAFDGDEPWAEVFARIGGAHGDAGQHLAFNPGTIEDQQRLELLEQLIGSLTMTYASGPHTGRTGFYPTVITLVEPYTAALIVAHISLTPQMLVAASTDILSRWYEGFPDRFVYPDLAGPGPNTADILFAALAADPPAATAFLLRISDQPGLLLRTAHDDGNVELLLIAGTNPGHVSAALAGQILVPLIETIGAWSVGSLGTAPRGEDLAPLMGSVVAPWLLQFGPRAEEFGWRKDQGDLVLSWLLANGAAANLAAGIAGWHDRLASEPLIRDNGTLDIVALNEMLEMFMQLERAVRDSEVSRAAADRILADAIFYLAVTLLPNAARGSVVVGIAADVAMSAAAPAIRSWTEDQGWVPPNEADARSAAQSKFGSRVADIAVLSVLGAVGQLIDSGKLPPEVLDRLDLSNPAGCVATETADRLVEFGYSLEPDLDPQTFTSVMLIIEAVAGPVAVTSDLCG